MATLVSKIPFNRIIHIGMWDNSSNRHSMNKVYSTLKNKYPGKEIHLMNGGFFNWDGTSALGLKVNGIMVNPVFSNEAFYAFNRGAKPELYCRGNNCPVHVLDAVAVHPPLLEVGKQHSGFSYCIDNTDRGRTMIGHNDTHFFMVCAQDVGGKSDLTLDEGVAYMKNLGCTYAGNLDGGGSSQCNLAGRVINSSRIVMNFIYAVVEPDNGTDGDHSSMSTQKQYQTWLNSEYGLGLAVDGSLGPATNRGQIMAMQTENGSDVDGSWGPASKREHKSFTLGSSYATPNRVRILQGALCRKGYDCGKIDGVFSYTLLSMLKSYQEANGLEVDGWAGQATFTSLFS